MEIVFPVSMLALGLSIGAFSVWFITRTKLKYEFDRGRTYGETERAVLQTRLEEERKTNQEKITLINNAETKLADAFKALSADALRNNNQSFLDLAKQNLEAFQQNAKGELERRQHAIGDLIKPLKESLEKVDGKIGELEKNRVGAYSELREQVKVLAQSHLQLQSETGNLVKALRVPHVRGRWGEIQLRRVVELAGMLQYCDFIEQETVATEESRIRPDLIVHLPGKRTIVVDSKVPFDAFYKSISTTDEEIRAARLKDHARLVRTHITALSRKSYWETVQPTPEFVLLFLPGETFYSAALEYDPKLIEDGVSQEVSNLAKTLYDRLRVFTNHFDDIGKNLDRALDSYNKGVRSLESRVLVTARRFKERGAIAGEEIEILEPVDKAARPLSFDDGGLFPEADMPLLKARSARSGKR